MSFLIDITDSEGWTATYLYDAADRLTRIEYPDTTTRTYSYDQTNRPLDLHE